MLPLTYIAVIILSFLSGITTLIGVWLALRFKKSAKGIAAGIGFSAGIMFWISLLELIPEAAITAGTLNTLIALILGFVLLLALHYIIPHTHMMKERGHIDHRLLKAAYMVAFGLILHDFPEGLAMANSYIYAPALGLLVALAIAIHNIPEEFAMAVPLVLTKRGGLIKIAFLSALAEPAGAVLGLMAVGIAPGLNPTFMAFAAGAMIFVSIHELFPMARRYKKPGWFALGTALSLPVYFGLTLLI